MTIKYTKIGDYYFPNLKMNPQPVLGKYAIMKRTYLKQTEPGRYHNMLVNEQLNDYLMHVQQEAEEMYDNLVNDFKVKRNVTEALKQQNQMLWVQEMNNIRNCVEEIIMNEIIYK